MDKPIYIITTSFNERKNIVGLLDCISKLDRSLFKWIVVDNYSSDGTYELIVDSGLATIALQKECSLYEGINIGLSYFEKGYYIVLGCDDKLYDVGLNIIKTAIMKKSEARIHFFPVDKNGKQVVPNKNNFFRRHFGWFSICASHSVGSAIDRSLHAKYGVYDLNYPILADGFFLTKVLFNKEKICIHSDSSVGSFGVEGTSSRNRRKMLNEVLSIMKQFSPKMFQYILYWYRVIKG